MNADGVPREDISGGVVEKLQAVLKDDAGLKTLMDSMTGLFASVLALDGNDEAYVESALTLDGPFTVETWISWMPASAIEDSLLGAPGRSISISTTPVSVSGRGGLHDVTVAKKPSPRMPGLTSP